MNKKQFLQLFELEKIYEQCQDRSSFGFGLLDNQTGTDNAIFYIFDEDKVKIIVECEEFNQEQKIQTLEIHLILHDENVVLNNDEIFINEIFPFLTFDTNFEAALKFIADYNNKILKPKYNLMGTISLY